MNEKYIKDKVPLVQHKGRQSGTHSYTISTSNDKKHTMNHRKNNVVLFKKDAGQKITPTDPE